MHSWDSGAVFCLIVRGTQMKAQDESSGKAPNELAFEQGLFGVLARR